MKKIRQLPQIQIERFNELLKIVSEKSNITKENILKKGRKRENADSRFILMKIMKKNTNLSLASIGYLIGKRNHATVISGIKEFEKLHSTSREFRELYCEINEAFLNIPEKLSYEQKKIISKFLDFIKSENKEEIIKDFEIYLNNYK